MQTSKRKDYLWNTVAGVINAAEAVIMSMVVTRMGTLSDAGILSLAFAVGNVLKTIGVFGGRTFQVTDIKRQYTYGMYLTQRFFSLVLMIITLVGFLFYSQYEWNKTIGIVLIAYIYMIEVIEDCVWGHYQALDKLYIGAQMFCTRWIAIFVAFIICMIRTSNMTTSLLAGAIVSTLFFLIWIIVLRQSKTVGKDISIDDWFIPSGLSWLPGMIKQIFPLFVAGFCSMVISNIPKFAIDRYMNDEVQACYGFVAMPVFVVGLLNQFIYQPTVVRMTSDYYDGKLMRFKKNVNKQMVIVAGIMALCVCGAVVIGIPVLSIIYSTNLENYWKELVILQFAGGFLGLSGYFNVILTIMRRQKIILEGYVVTLVLGIVILNVAVKMAGTVGASLGYLAVRVMLFIYYFISYVRNVDGGKE